jgi:salicylate hydroxylase
MHVAIVGAGIGGLACAIACRRASPPLRVTVLEKAAEILTIGAGIHIPPNACRVLSRFGLLDRLKLAGGYQVDRFTLRRYEDGRILVEKPLKGRVEKVYGAEWM